MHTCNLSNLDGFINSIFDNTSNKCKFAEPACLVAAAALSESNKNIQLDTVFNDDVLSYIGNTRTGYSNTKPYFPLQKFDAFRSVSDTIASSLSNTIALAQHFSTPSEAEDFKRYVRYSTSEIINNVADHSNSLFGGYVAAQFYPKSSKAQIAIADQGIGLFNSLSNNYKILTEEEAILSATEKGVTGSNEKMYGSGALKNAGVGLFAIKKIIQETGGVMHITSNNTSILFNGKSIPKISKLKHSFNGTLVAIEIYDSGLDNEFDVFKRIHIWSTAEDSEELF